jgi:hypothetical protein
MTTSGNCEDNTINYYFIGNEEDIKQENIFKYFDTNYIPMNNILLSYYMTVNPHSENQDFINIINKLNNNKNGYNNFNIYPLLIFVIIIVISIFVILLRFLYVSLYHVYSYLLIFIILILIIIGSIWFLYINNQTL